MDKKRPDDSGIIDEAAELPTPSHQGSGGGGMARTVGQRDEEKNFTGDEPLPTSVDGRDKPEDGDLPTPPQQHQ